MKIIAVIPARYQSVRFPGKPLALISGKPMVERVYKQVAKFKKLADIIVATDDLRIAEAVGSFGGRFVITSPDHSSGTERIWEIFENSHYDAVINIQGDEPVIPEDLIAGVYEKLKKGNCQVVSAAYKNKSYGEFLSNNIVKVVINRKNEAIYFSRSPIPCAPEDKFSFFYQHIGIYGYTRKALQNFINFPRSHAEKLEELEQLRFVDNSIPIQIIETGYCSVSADIPSDIAKIETFLKAQEKTRG